MKTSTAGVTHTSYSFGRWDGCQGWMCSQGRGCALRVHGTGQVSAASLRGQERRKQAAGAGRMVSPLPMPCETAGNIAIVNCSSGMWGGSVNQYFTTAHLPDPCSGVAEVGQRGRK